MGMSTAELQQKYKMLPNRRTVTLKRGSTTVDASIAGAVRRPVSKSTVAFAANIGLGRIDAEYMLPTVNCSEEPRENDYIVDTDSWDVKNVRTELEGAIYRCLCRKRT